MSDSESHVVIPPSVLHPEGGRATQQGAVAQTPPPSGVVSTPAQPAAPEVNPHVVRLGPEGNTEPWKPTLPDDAPPGAVYRMGEGEYVDGIGQPVKPAGTAE